MGIIIIKYGEIKNRNFTFTSLAEKYNTVLNLYYTVLNLYLSTLTQGWELCGFVLILMAQFVIYASLRKHIAM